MKFKAPSVVVLLCGILFLIVQGNAIQTNRIVISTSPGDFPILIDGSPAGETTEYARPIQLPPGPHRVEISLPDNNRWVHDLSFGKARMQCIALNYRPPANARASKQEPAPPASRTIGPTTTTLPDGSTVTTFSDGSTKTTSTDSSTTTTVPSGKTRSYMTTKTFQDGAFIEVTINDCGEKEFKGKTRVGG
jgi:hypothetical protein